MLRNGARDWLAYGGLLLVGGVMDVYCRAFPADLPFWMPWEFSWPVFLLTTLTLAWFIRGRIATPAAERPPLWRAISFVLGVLLSYAAVQTKYDYLSEHMFLFHRLQHLLLHHLGPFFIALGGAGSLIWRGMPAFLHPPLKSRPVRAVVDFVQHPAVAPVLFVGLIYFWLIPDVHTRVMLDIRLYDVMNWSMAVDGIFFWCLLLDPRPKPPARLGLGVRVLLAAVVIPPQIVIGALLALTNKDYYPVYNICGRILPITAISDQHYGGLILWIPSSMMSVIAALVILNNLRLADEKAEAQQAKSA